VGVLAGHRQPRVHLLVDVFNGDELDEPPFGEKRHEREAPLGAADCVSDESVGVRDDGRAAPAWTQDEAVGR
jgi:hypothetical protein